jgi:hypothetical protein
LRSSNIAGTTGNSASPLPSSGTTSTSSGGLPVFDAAGLLAGS